jgi:hypothetical protein
LQQQIDPEQQSPRQSVVKLFTPGATYREVKRALDELHAEGYDVKIDQLPDGGTRIIGSPKRAPTSSAHEPGPMQDAARGVVPGTEIIAQFPSNTDPSIIEAITRQLDQQGRKYIVQHDANGGTAIVNQLRSGHDEAASENTASTAGDAKKLAEALNELDTAREAVIAARKNLPDVVAKWKNVADSPLTTELSEMLVSAACDSDPNYELYKQQFRLIEKQLKQRQASAASSNDPDIQRLQQALKTTKDQADAYRT